LELEMDETRIFVFDSDDKSYLHWIASHPDGFVINTPRSRDPNYMILHCSVCWTIQDYQDKNKIGGFTERQYIKICAEEIESLREWVKENGRANGSFSQECQHCNSSKDLLYDEDDY
jgi:hypothetical protein